MNNRMHPSATNADPDETPARDLAALRARMVEEQLRKHGISDERTLEAMRRVPREEFVPAGLCRAAYADGPLPIGSGQTISQPYTVAFMCQALKLTGAEKVLEIGTGSGYAARPSFRYWPRPYLRSNAFRDCAEAARAHWQKRDSPMCE